LEGTVNDIQIEETAQDYFKYKVAGWFALVAAALTPPIVLLSFVTEVRPRSLAALMPVIVLLGVFHLIFDLYAFLQFRNFLNERYRFHKADTLVTVIIFGSIAVTCVIYIGKAFPVLAIPALVMLIAIGVPLSVVGIMFGVRLLKMPGSLYLLGIMFLQGEQEEKPDFV
jgi:hypothetical protein